jgi:hypothetical protein
VLSRSSRCIASTTLHGSEGADGTQKGFGMFKLVASQYIQLFHRRLRAQHEATETADRKVESIGQHADGISTHGGIDTQIPRAGDTHIGKKPLSRIGKRIPLAAGYL